MYTFSDHNVVGRYFQPILQCKDYARINLPQFDCGIVCLIPQSKVTFTSPLETVVRCSKINPARVLTS